MLRREEKEEVKGVMVEGFKKLEISVVRKNICNR